MSDQEIIERLERIEKTINEQVLLKKKLWSLVEAMTILGVSRTTLYDWIRKKNLPAYKPENGKLFFIRKEVIYWLRAKKSCQVLKVERIPDNTYPDLEQD